MDLELPAVVAGQLERCKVVLGNLQSELEPLLSVSGRDLDKQLDPLDRAQLHLRLAGALCVLYQLFLRARGLDAATHPIAKEAERLDLYKRKVAKVTAEKSLQESRPTVQLNVAAANRFINSAIPDLTPMQRSALRQAGAVSRKQQQEERVAVAAPKRKADYRSEAADFLEDTLSGLQPPPASRQRH